MGRAHEHEIRISAPAERVWAALTDPEEMVRWYVEDADVEPREGGRYWVSWGEGMDGPSRITVWDPPSRLRLEQQPLENPPEGWPDPPPLDEPIFEEFTLTEEGGVTTLRLHNGSIPESSDWDGFYDGTNVGWDGYFHVLRHYLERHAGRPKRMVTVSGQLGEGVDAATAWQRLTGPDGLGIGAVASGGEVDGKAATGERIAGEVIDATPPGSLLMNVASMDDALLGLMIMPGWVTLSLWRYGADADEVAQQQTRWQEWLGGLLG
jgi:uncharacterized protein YndB with AHSA1/START domain